MDNSQAGSADDLPCRAVLIGPRGTPLQAVQVLAAATAIRKSLALDHFRHEEQYRRAIAASYYWLGPDDYQSALQQGLGMELEEGIATTVGSTDHSPKLTGSNGVRTLSPRERDVLQLLIRGKSNPEIAHELSISRKTEAIRVSEILGRLGVDSRSAAGAVALRERLVE